MRRAGVIAKELEQITTIKNLTGVFESIATTHIAKVKGKVEISKIFFGRLWRLYRAVRADGDSFFDPAPGDIQKKVFVMISAEGGLSGDIDQRLIENVLRDYDPETTDLIVIGDHGAGQLIQRKIKFVNYFRVPSSENYVDVGPILAAIAPYDDVTVYYEAYISLGVQEIKKINLNAQVREMGEEAEEGDDEILLDLNTVFEPSLEEIIEHMELQMMSLVLAQVILESGLAQDASRFNAMAVAKKRAGDMVGEYKLDFHRAKRGESDRRLREVMVSLKKKKKRARGV